MCLSSDLYFPYIDIRFDENYALASTQSLKNKDIPEGEIFTFRS